MKKILSVFLSVVMAVGAIGINAFAAENGSKSIEANSVTVIACSDFQNPNGNEAGKQVVSNLLSTLAGAGITRADGLLQCGDYDYEYSDTKEGINTLKEAFGGVVDTENMVFTQGNHDSDIGTNGMSPSGNNDSADGEYGVFVINEDDYMWKNTDEGTIKETAQSLIEYMNEKISQKYDKPIFVLSHLPLHYSMRTRNDGDGKYANYIFDVLNMAGEKGLNIVFLYGHDHSNGWDDYLGGAAVYLPKGDKILIAQQSQTVFAEKTLNFTYMNAGFIGYYSKVNDGVDDTLTMTVFKITDDEMNIVRYDREGVHNLKSAGVRNDNKGESGYDPNTTVYTSPQTVTLTEVTNTESIPDLIESPKPTEPTEPPVSPEPPKPTEPPTSEEGLKYQYVRVKSISDLKDGEKYLLVYNNGGSNYIMLPKVVERESGSGVRVGFDLDGTTAFDYETVNGDYANRAWTFTKSGDGWLIGDGKKYVALTNTDNYAITATLEDAGNVFTIGSGEYDNTYTFTSGSYMLNFNSGRQLINGYESNPASFYIYEYALVPPTETKVSKTDTGIKCEIDLNNVPKDSVILISGYLGERMVYAPQIIITAQADTTETVTFTGNADTVKVFICESLASLRPVCAAEVLSVK